eukprot:TRINITY_DN33867_c0_g1_i1.p1 TRINITY_DN33867_c0_g1~~TRINITY_DN33867_c0_g1_i1.p1  ORF type:complete len:306 (+),score=60.97 TRINITY_DN33867_c0_g1_i1:82-918(+)
MGGLANSFRVWFYQSSLYRRRVWVSLFLAVMLIVKLLSVRNEFCFESRNKMQVMLMNVHSAMNEGGTEWWVDYGTLLGGVREGRLIEHEYDLDLGIPASAAAILGTKKAMFEKHGITLYTRNDYIASKSKLTYDTQEGKFTFSSGYIHSPCLRLYGKQGYFTDIYCYSYIPVTAARTRVAVGDFINLPKHGKQSLPYDLQSEAAEGLLCCDTALNKRLDEGTGCLMKSTLYPLKSVTIYGKTFPAPNDPEGYLKEYYGKEWRTPITKGVRGPICYLHA